MNDGATIRHYNILTESNQYYITKGVIFHSLNELVHYYMLKAYGLCCRLSVPLTKPVNIPTTPDMWEIEKSSIEFLKCLTTGEFGETWEANLLTEESSVMIKTNIATNIPQVKFLNEANILKKLCHDNIICLYGVCTKEYPFYIVTELMTNGNVKAYLEYQLKLGRHFKPSDLAYIAVQVVNGMIYLGEQDFIHCDLRAENILAGGKMYAQLGSTIMPIVKIANFHLAQYLNGKKYWYTQKGTCCAPRWTAPEGYKFFQISIKSDVWSFGILLWELVTKGREPYPGMTTEEVLKAVPQGYRMPIPKGCPEPLYQIMLKCWKSNDDERPTFRNIYHNLSRKTA